jgi:hypothetical protein
MESVRVLFIASARMASFGGIQSFLSDLSSALAAEGCPNRKFRLSFFSYTYRNPVTTVNLPLLTIPPGSAPILIWK